ncbi:MAG: transglutaminase domain-containing protein [Candidatus Dormibacteria bacterium]
MSDDAPAPVAPPRVSGLEVQTDEILRGDAPEQAGEAAPEAVEAPRASPLLTGLAGLCASAAAAWMVAGVFRGFSAHLVGLLGVGIGAGLVILSHRLRNAAALQWLVVPAAALTGAILVAPDAHAGSSSLVGLVVDAVHSGGLLQPPISFDPGWRFVLVVIFALLAAASCSLAVNTNRPKLAVLLPGPVVAGAALIQPSGTEIISTAVALVLVVIGLALAYGAELGSDGNLSSGFELQRLGRGVAFAGGLAGLLVALSSLGILFPQPNRDRTIPPQAPQTPPEEPDRVLFRYTSTRPVPLRLGVIDVYDTRDSTWKLPPYDTRRLERLAPPTKIPGTKGAGINPIRAAFSIADVRGHAIPDIAGITSFTGPHDAIDYDRRTGAVRLADKPAFPGLHYSIIAVDLAAIPVADMAKAGAPDVDKHYLDAPKAPPEVIALLAQYEQAIAKLGVPADAFNRLQFLRNRLLQQVVASGAGTPTTLPATRVAQMLNGGEGSPYEITAAEALLARWAGVPSRIGYGYYGGDKSADGSFEIRPKDGTTFLEAYFKGYGWIPLVGVPPHAKPSTTQSKKKKLPNVHESDQLALEVLVPVEYDNPHQLFEYVRYYLGIVGGPALALLALLAGYPWLLKLLRGYVRNLWAKRTSPRARVAVVYCEFRDRARDLAIGDPSATPIEFLGSLDADAEHDELAWLVTRAIWGDLGRDLRDEDVRAAGDLAKSLTRRFLRAQSPLNRVLGAIARTSLREPYTREIPNFWLERTNRGELRRRYRRFRRDLTLRRHGRRSVLAPAIGVVACLLLSGCGDIVHASNRKFPDKLIPASIGQLDLKRDRKSEKAYTSAGRTSLAQTGRVYLIEHDEGIIEGSLQVTVFKDKVNTDDLNDESLSGRCLDNPLSCTGLETFIGMQTSLGGTNTFHRFYYRDRRGYFMQVADPAEQVYMWFPPHTQSMMLMILRSQFPGNSGLALYHALIDYQVGARPSAVPIPSPSFLTASPSPSPASEGGGSPSPGGSSSPGTGGRPTAGPSSPP